MYRNRRWQGYSSRTRSRRSYSLSHLVSGQPKSLATHEHYATMMNHFRSSARLANIQINRRCYALLNDARIAPHNLIHFYRTYRLPCDPFFPLFFEIKRDYLAQRKRIQKERRNYILTQTRALPATVLAQIKYLGYLERHYNQADRSPVWQRDLLPTSKKQVNAYARFDPAEWLRVYRRHLSILLEKYPSLRPELADKVLACFVLGITPSAIPPGLPSASEATGVYRRLSLLHHPDRGGRPEAFMAIKRARDVLVGE